MIRLGPACRGYKSRQSRVSRGLMMDMITGISGFLTNSRSSHRGAMVLSHGNKACLAGTIWKFTPCMHAWYTRVATAGGRGCVPWVGSFLSSHYPQRAITPPLTHACMPPPPPTRRVTCPGPHLRLKRGGISSFGACVYWMLIVACNPTSFCDCGGAVVGLCCDCAVTVL